MSDGLADWPQPLREFLDAHPEFVPSIFSHCPEGWAVIVRDALVRLRDLSVSSGVRIHIGQIKEKFGGLRIYLAVDEPSVGGLTEVERTPFGVRLRSGALPGSVFEQALKIVDEASALAARSCATCGSPGRLFSRGGYLLTACQAHSVEDDREES